MFSHKERMIKIEVTDCERRIILNALTQLRDQQIRENKNYDFIDVNSKIKITKKVGIIITSFGNEKLS